MVQACNAKKLKNSIHGELAVQPERKDGENEGALPDLAEDQGKNHHYREITKRNYGDYERVTSVNLKNFNICIHHYYKM